MKIAVLFAVVACALAAPAEVETDIDLSQLTPNNIYVEPNNPVDESTLPESRVIGGTEAARNSIPYIVALIINGGSFCGGSLISTTRVLTAAHCTVSASTVNVRLGAHAFNTNEATQVRVTSTSVRNHASYNSQTISNDIAIVLLPSAVTLNSNIQVISLAPASSGNFAGSSALLAGWGRTSDSSNAVSAVLRRVTLSVITNAVCRSAYNIVQDSNICTSGAGTVGACNGDSGGPLTVNGVQVGIVSFGSARCEAGNPTAYARVSTFRAWITQNAGV
ncbi:hypothetical protein NQ315_016160 [Exocentrus adspersus]|uniref:Peptidase S1 domain-containing protein n=1 Tax=Exocentrus adspersus TaxID=1586481 RepID=A0AAV8VG29_9CUCU|nr:hypothetical protein NQ315_016160 [Exocentrus adspersus]